MPRHYANTDTDSNSDPNAGGFTNANTESNSDSNSGRFPNANTDPNAGHYTNTDANAGCHAKSDTNGDTDRQRRRLRADRDEWNKSELDVNIDDIWQLVVRRNRVWNEFDPADRQRLGMV